MIKKTVIIILGIYVLLLVGIYFFQERIIFRAKDLSKDHVYNFESNFEEVDLITSHNISLNSLHFKVDNPKGVILYFHGNKGNLERWGHKVKPLLNYGYDLFIIDYRGYGKNEGKRTEKNMYEDAQLSYDYLLKTYSEDEIVVYGRSLGGTFATYVASNNNPKQLILEATFTSIIDVSKSIIPIFPFKKLYKFHFNSFKMIPNINVPTVIFHGKEDSLVPIRIAEELHSYSNKGITELIQIDNGTHHNLEEFDVYKEKLKSILK
jgi:pimeloyl-ACP methyl ester carboxylesterase